MPTYTIEIVPQLTFVKFYLDTFGLTNKTVPHPTLSYARILPRQVEFTNGAENLNAPELMLNWLKQRYTAEALPGAVKILADTDKDGITQFEEFAFGFDPNRVERTSVNVTYFLGEKRLAIEDSRNLDQTGITHTIEVGDGTIWTPAVENVDYVAADLTGTGLTELVENFGTTRRVRRVLKNLHSGDDKAFIRVRLTQTITV